MWYQIISIVISAIALLITVLNFRQNKDNKEAEELKEKFDLLEEKLEDLQEQCDNFGILQERVNNHTKYLDKIEDKVDEIIKLNMSIKR